MAPAKGGKNIPALKQGAAMTACVMEFKRDRVSPSVRQRTEAQTFLKMANARSFSNPGNREMKHVLLRQRGIVRFAKHNVVAVRVGHHHRFDLAKALKGTSNNSFVWRIVSSRGARNPHVPERTPRMLRSGLLTLHSQK